MELLAVMKSVKLHLVNFSTPQAQVLLQLQLDGSRSLERRAEKCAALGQSLLSALLSSPIHDAALPIVAELAQHQTGRIDCRGRRALQTAIESGTAAQLSASLLKILCAHEQQYVDLRGRTTAMYLAEADAATVAALFPYITLSSAKDADSATALMLWCA